MVEYRIDVMRVTRFEWEFDCVTLDDEILHSQDVAAILRHKNSGIGTPEFAYYRGEYYRVICTSWDTCDPDHPLFKCKFWRPMSPSAVEQLFTEVGNDASR